ncbi:nucleolar complex protein 2 [[Candida] jaroonii]|uniref:Nucleolar complex protein 2 n=1 Tax=[Candida] jaroonii TaxID=467808 RepID=A0ACA9Y005_9ASCO|nr:nucleolar complex protein 2 [[Candida] jaroonii]
MGKTGKATKKFQKNHLKHTLDHRKQVQKHSKLVQCRKKKPTGDNDNEPKGKSKEIFEDMSVDDFFEGGFEVPKPKKNAKPIESEDDESSEEEDIEDIEQNMKDLQSKDPEFFKYLQNNDKDLLDFEGSNPLDAISDDEEEEQEEDDVISEDEIEPVEEEIKNKVKKTEITLPLVKSWEKELVNKPSPKIIKQVCMAFKAAININNDSEEYKYVITNPKAFNQLMLLTLKQLPESIQTLVKYKNTNNVRVIPQKNQNVSQISAILKSHASSFITLLNDINNVETATLVLFSLQEVFPYYLSFRKLLKEILSSVINIWSSTKEVEIQIATFAFLNNVSKEFPKSIMENVLKLSYTIFLKNCRKTNHFTMPLLNFCKNSAAELYGIDETLSYQIGFEYVRQLAIHLRNSINATSNAKEGYKTIYNWQYCHSLDFWSRVLSQQCNPEKELQNHKNKESPLRQLIYPLVQVTLGAIRLIPTAQFFPLRFYLIRSLIRLSQSTGVFIPIFPLISEILNSNAFTKNAKRVHLPVFDFENNIKVNQQYLGTKVYQEGLSEQFIELSYEFFVLYCKNIAFPELVTPAVISLRRFIKKSKNIKFNKQLSQLIEKLNENAQLITQKRSKVEYGPSNKTEVQNFLNDFKWEKTPLGQYVIVQRKAKEARLKLLQEAIEQEEEARNQRKKADDDSDIEIDEAEDDDDEDDDDMEEEE